MIWCLSFLETFWHFNFNYLFCSIMFSFTSWYSNYKYVTTPFVIFPQFLDVLFCFYHYFSVAFQFGELLLTYLQDHWLFWLVEFTDKPIKGILFFYCILLMSRISIWFLELPSFLLILPICSCMLPTFSIRDLNILVIVIWNFLYNNFKNLSWVSF